MAAFGGGRGHQGEDVFAACGTPLVAAHGGVVKFAGYHARAGNYLVIDNEGAGTDYAYMHLRDVAAGGAPARACAPGQPIGFVGDTRRRERLPPALRDLDRARLVRRRAADRPAAHAALLGRRRAALAR